MNKELQHLISAYTEQPHCLDSIVVSSFVKNNALQVNGGLLANYYKEDTAIAEVESIEDVINVFEQAIPKRERTKNGAVYTPKYIRDYILNRTVALQTKPIQNCLCIDIACGCGAFLYSLADLLHTKSGLSYRDSLRHLFGVDICESSLERCTILLSLAALRIGETLDYSDFNLFHANSLDFNFSAIHEVAENGGFDIIVGNPPYVRSKHIDEDSKQLLSNWEVARCGNADLYLPFFEIGYNILNDEGVLGFITLNSFFKSVNARLLRKYFRKNNAALEIVDFGNQLVFDKTLAYTCIAIIEKQGKPGVKYTKGQIDINGFTLNPEHFNYVHYSNLDDHKGWNVNSADVLQNINKIESIGRPLGEMFQIKNGIATLANDIYIFRPVREDDAFYYLSAESIEFPIEKGICRDIIKPNILHNEEEIPNIIEKIIFPYDENNKILIESVFISKYPNAYKYLSLNKIKLAQRDKGEKIYEAWYAFGRTQATGDRGRKLLFPYMTDHPHFVYTDNESLLIYCGYAIFSEKEEDLLVLKRILESSVFDYYMQHTAKPYATGYYSYAKNYVKNFGVPILSQEQRIGLLSLKGDKAINDYVERLYNINN